MHIVPIRLFYLGIILQPSSTVGLKKIFIPLSIAYITDTFYPGKILLPSYVGTPE
jgi:hypothetical protein